MSLDWFILALIFAIFTSIYMLVVKKLTQKMDFLLIILASGIFGLPYMLILILLTTGIPSISSKFYLFTLSSSVLDVIASISSFFSISISQISLISPISSFNPVFTTIFAALTIHEIPSITKLLGILVIVIGSYLLNISEAKTGIFVPFKKLFTNKGVLFSLLAYFIWGITPIFQKQAIFQTHPNAPLFTSFSGGVLITLFMLPIVLVKVKNPLSQLKKTWRWFALLGPIDAISAWAAFTAFSRADLGSVTSIFKLSALFTVVWGLLFFKEERIKERLLGASVMIAGTILLLR